MNKIEETEDQFLQEVRLMERNEEVFHSNWLLMNYCLWRYIGLLWALALLCKVYEVSLFNPFAWVTLLLRNSHQPQEKYFTSIRFSLMRRSGWNLFTLLLLFDSDIIILLKYCSDFLLAFLICSFPWIHWFGLFLKPKQKEIVVNFMPVEVPFSLSQFYFSSSFYGDKPIAINLVCILSVQCKMYICAYEKSWGWQSGLSGRAPA
jgi:hypothetical protein